MTAYTATGHIGINVLITLRRLTDPSQLIGERRRVRINPYSSVSISRKRYNEGVNEMELVSIFLHLLFIAILAKPLRRAYV